MVVLNAYFSRKFDVSHLRPRPHATATCVKAELQERMMSWAGACAIEISFSEWRKSIEWLEVRPAMCAVRVEQIVLLFRRRKRTSSWDVDNCFSMLYKVQIAFVHFRLFFERMK